MKAEIEIADNEGWTVYQGGPFGGFTVWGLRSACRNVRVATLNAVVSRTDNAAAEIQQGTYVFNRARLQTDGRRVHVFEWRGGQQ
jgi:hypothetical protein